MSSKISIIITTYNGSQFIAETIESIVNQTYKNWELIVVDDGSEDNTEEIVKSFSDDRIVFYAAGRIGINGKIKNIGLKMSSGELYAFIDHDDLWESSKLEKQVLLLQEYPEAGFCLTGGYNFRKREEPLEFFYKQREGIRFDNIFLSIFRSEAAPWTQALLIRRQCIETAGSFSEDSLFADPEFIYRMAYHFKAVILYDPLVYRRLHSTNYTSLNWMKSHYDGLDIIRTYKKNKMLPEEIANNVLFRSYMNFGEKCLKYKMYGKALRSFLAGWKKKPFSMIPIKKITKTALSFLGVK